jgi:mannosylglucosylglycerate synthase
MRIALLHYSAPPVIGGVERVLAEQAQMLARHGHEITVVCGHADAHLLGHRITVRIVPGLIDYGLEDALRDHDTIIVHNVFTMPFNLAATRRLRELAMQWDHVQWINWVHDLAAINPSYAHLPWDDAEHRLLRLAPPNCLHIAVSELRKKQFLELMHLPDGACRVVPNGIEVASVLGLTDRVSASARELSLWDRDYVLLHPTRVLRRKNIECTLRVTHALQAQGLDVVTLITGAPDPHNADGIAYGDDLRALIDELGLQDSVRFLGNEAPLTDADVRSLYVVADAVFFPSLSEGFGLPILEAALHQVPIFCSDIPAHREVGKNTAQFFQLDDEPADIAWRITEHATVTSRYLRRSTVAAWHDWDSVYAQHFGSLL